ncbi:hypothetical protein COB55_06045 [Candidatus Wolfebacteria bacterium]|nr:MAG: hypothetical protein COB55_06045 [Candidatus Wolfebacteria bacterium]
MKDYTYKISESGTAYVIKVSGGYDIFFSSPISKGKEYMDRKVKSVVKMDEENGITEYNCKVESITNNKERQEFIDKWMTKFKNGENYKEDNVNN